jgi:hypothetical protein
MTTMIGTFVSLIISGMVLMISMIGTFVWLIIAFFASFAIMATTMYPFLNDELAEMEIQKMIEKGYLNVDYTIEELGGFCHTYYNVLFEEGLDYACFWFL